MNQTYICKCGAKVMVKANDPADCDACDHCGTVPVNTRIANATFKLGAHHTWIIKFDDETGEPYNICTKCLAVR